MRLRQRVDNFQEVEWVEGIISEMNKAASNEKVSCECLARREEEGLLLMAQKRGYGWNSVNKDGDGTIPNLRCSLRLRWK